METTLPPSSTPEHAKRIELFGCAIDALTMDETLHRVDEFVASGRPHEHVVVNVNKLIKANRDPELRAIINACDLVNCDGMWVVWASRLLGAPLPERVTGIDLFQKLIARSVEKGWRVFLLGARDEVVARVRDIFVAKYPTLQLAGYRNGYWKPEDEPAVVASIRNSRPDLLFVAIGSPKKELFLGRNLEALGVPFAMGVGGSFDVVAGVAKRAPKWMQQSGLEWFYRFLQEPRRLFGRYFLEGLSFAGLVAKALWCRATHREFSS
jgi:N-acetylglucosaminyldiphosphoundecaprenol N-acetyl-beta-D-mannosaminyltransferase